MPLLTMFLAVTIRVYGHAFRHVYGHVCGHEASLQRPRGLEVAVIIPDMLQ